MTEKIKILSKRATCIFIDNDYILIFRNNRIYKRWDNGKEELICKVYINTKVPSFLLHFRLVQRLIRIEPRAFCHTKSRYLFFAIKKNIYKLDMTRNIVTTIKTMDSIMSAPLTITHVDSIQEFHNEIMFGEYYKNANMNQVKIHCYNYENDQWRILYTYPNGVINHIHSIIADYFRNRLWILTGDCNSCSKISYTDDGFKSINEFLGGSQQFRSCFLFPTNDGILYATDSPDEINHIYHVDIHKRIRVISELNGSVIYGCQHGEKFVISTTVEPSQYRHLIFNLLSYKLGKGILTRKAEILVGNQENINIIFSDKKDIYPMGLFQFGTFNFPAGIENSKRIIANGKSLVKTDHKVFEIIKEINE